MGQEGQGWIVGTLSVSTAGWLQGVWGAGLGQGKDRTQFALGG